MAEHTPISVAGQISEPQTETSNKEETSNIESSVSTDAEKNVKVDDSLTSYEEPQYLTGLRLGTVVACLMLAVFCVALDNTIVATAIPRITDTFHAIDDTGWYGSAYLLTTCSFQILYAKFYTFFNVKWVFLVALFVFELGSLICGVAPSSTALIIGRAIAGLGSSGLYSGAATAIAATAPINLRPILTGLLGGLFGFSSIIGPLLGGALTDKVSWRWCFYINLPIGGATALGILFFLDIDQKLQKLEGGIITRIEQFDPIGNILFVCAVICLLLAVQWGGTTYAYSNGRIIALFVLFGVLSILFISDQIHLGEKATVPRRISTNRTILPATLFAFAIGGAVFPVVYYLPIWFQAIASLSPITSAVHTLPLILSQLLSTILAGALTTRLGTQMPFVYLSAILLPVGTGLMMTFHTHMPSGKWIGYQILTGFGFGFGFQQATVAAQASLPMVDIPIGTAVVFSAQFLGGAVFLSVAENVFANHLVGYVEELGIVGLDPRVVVRTGATELRGLVGPSELENLLGAYNHAITKAFEVGLCVSCVMIIGAVGMPWTRMKNALATGDK